MRIGFLYRRVRKTYYKGDLGVGSVFNLRGLYGKEFVKLMRWHQDGASGDFWLGLVERWLKEQALIRELVDCSVYLPEYIELMSLLKNSPLKLLIRYAV
jgi:hypothetical protein